jgi:hypothetical protein
VRFALLPRLAAAVFVLVVGSSVPSAAQQPAEGMTLREAARLGGEALAAQPSQLQILPQRSVAEARRPGALVPLYVSLATLNALDVHSTRRALSRGAVEGNPLMKGVAENSGALVAVKAASTVGIIYGSEKLWKRNRAAAVIFMIATNSAMAWVVQHNYRAVR